MDIRVYPGVLAGEIPAVSSKSFAHRSLICAALCQAPTRLLYRGLSQDICASIDCLRALGTKIDVTQNALTVTPGPCVPREPPVVLPCGESGSTLRFMLPVAAALCENFCLTGRGRLPGRPMEPICRALQGVCSFSQQHVPMTVRGRLTPGVYTLPGNISSQYITGLLLALPLLQKDSRLVLSTPLSSKSYIDLTLQVQALFGVHCVQTDGGFLVPGGQHYRAVQSLTAPGDWSNAAFFLCAGLLQGGGVSVSGLVQDAQGDRAAADLCRQILSSPAQTEIDIDPTPDLLPILAVAACKKQGVTRFINAARLRLKESDRIASTAALLTALGAQVQQEDAALTVTGTGHLQGGTADCCNDHRIAMAGAIAALLCTGPVTLLGAQAVEKSYPEFFDDFAALGGKTHVLLR